MAKVLVTGSQGFIGKNLVLRLKEDKHDVIEFLVSDCFEKLESVVSEVDFIFHLAGVNRPKDEIEFTTGNVDLTKQLINSIRMLDRDVPILFTSSIQAEKGNSYGVSKKKAEEELLSYRDNTGNTVFIYRLPNVFGKWCKPNYNSVVATFCHNVINDIPLVINDESAIINLVYIDDVVNDFILQLGVQSVELHRVFKDISPIYQISVGELANKLKQFKESRVSLVTDNVGSGLSRALYSTYLSYMEPEHFSYTVPVYTDERGRFSELIKTPEHGQFSFFTAKPGIIRGGHYHHTKNEKFIVVKGKALFGFKNMNTGEYVEIIVSSEKIKIVETIPGWAHNIKNVGNDEMVVLLWANEIFDREKPDTIYAEIT